MKSCIACGTPLENISGYCPTCGHPVDDSDDFAVQSSFFAHFSSIPLPQYATQCQYMLHKVVFLLKIRYAFLGPRFRRPS
jgi:predicted amidophosphoribosyltransferase